jgi:hypothetical protein
MVEAEPSFDAPLPGMSLTAEVGSRPWQNPPKYATVDEVVDHYVTRMVTPSRTEELLDIMELGVPVSSLADSLQMAGVMNGLHTVDVGVLVTPVIMETLAYMAERKGIEYELGMSPTKEGMKEEEDKISDVKIALAMKKVRNSENKDEDKSMDVEESVEEKEPMPTGLMARRT